MKASQQNAVFLICLLAFAAVGEASSNIDRVQASLLQYRNSLSKAHVEHESHKAHAHHTTNSSLALVEAGQDDAPKKSAAGPFAQIMKNWILKQIAASETPYCWRNSIDRAGQASALTSCDSGFNYEAGLCYANCPQYTRGVGLLCHYDCPGGYNDNGLTCTKPSNGRGGGYGWCLFCRISDARDRCNNENGQGCEKLGLLWYPKCWGDYSDGMGAFCYKPCPASFNNLGAFCGKPNAVGRETRTPHCGGKEQVGGLCYPQCPSGYYSVAHICWQNCPSTQPVGCGAGCAVDNGSCTSAVAEMILAPLELVGNIVATVMTAGGATAAKTAAKAALVTAKTAATSAAKAIARSGARAAMRSLVTAMRNKIKDKLFQKLLRKMIAEQAEGFIEAAATSMASQYVNGDDMDGLKILMDLDPTGIAGVVDAFNKPKCTFDEEAPVVDTTQMWTMERGDVWNKATGRAAPNCNAMTGIGNNVYAFDNEADAVAVCGRLHTCNSVAVRDNVWYLYSCFELVTGSQDSVVYVKESAPFGGDSAPSPAVSYTTGVLWHNYYNFWDIGRQVSNVELVVAIQGSNDGHLRLGSSNAALCDEVCVELVIGGWANTRSVLRVNQSGNMLADASTRDILTASRSRLFWVKYLNGVFSWGRGGVVGANQVSSVNRNVNVRYIGFSSWDVPMNYVVVSVKAV